MNTFSCITLSLIVVTLFSCQSKSSKTDDDKLKLTIIETFNNDSIIHQLIKIDSICSENLSHPILQESHEHLQDTNVSLIELLGGKEEPPMEDEDTDKAMLEKAEKEHPLFFCLQPNLDEMGNAINSSIIGHSLRKDTSRVIDMIKLSKVFENNVETKWVTGWTPEIFSLVLYRSNAKTKELNNLSIDKIEYEITESFKNDIAIQTAAKLTGQLEYYLTITPKDVIDLTIFSDQKKTYLFEIELCGKKYPASQSLDSFYEGLFIKIPILQKQLDSLLIHYPSLLRKKLE